MPQITMKDIATRAGVARQTVSKILNKKDPDISQETREKVLDIVRELKYQPNYFARSLKKGKTNCIGIMGSRGTMLGFDVGYYSRTASAVENELVRLKSGYSLVAFGANYHETFEKSLELIAKGMVDGLILITLSQNIKHFERDLLPSLQEYNLPFVVAHSLKMELVYNNVGVDTEYGGYLKAQHLAGLGHKTLGYLLRKRPTPHSLEDLAGFKRGVREAGLPESAVRIMEVEFGHGKKTSDSVLDTMQECKDLPPAIFAPNDETAYAVIQALNKRGVQVPEDIAVMGSDDEPLPHYIPNDLTSLHHPLEEKGTAAINLLLDILSGKKSPDQVHRVSLKPELVVRRTCGAKPNG
jgi:DNA-binding LacI/PurR family transcriptional regulator